MDSKTGQPVQCDTNFVRSGSLDDDSNATWSLGRMEDGTIRCERNVWIEFDIVAPGYDPLRVRLDEKSPPSLQERITRSAR